jgi:hypothetical protein
MQSRNSCFFSCFCRFLACFLFFPVLSDAFNIFSAVSFPPFENPMEGLAASSASLVAELEQCLAESRASPARSSAVDDRITVLLSKLKVFALCLLSPPWLLHALWAFAMQQPVQHLVNSPAATTFVFSKSCFVCSLLEALQARTAQTACATQEATNHV